MGMNETAAASGDEQMNLGRAGADQYQVARLGRPRSRFEPVSRGRAFVPCNTRLAHRIGGKRASAPPYRGEGREHEADAVEAGLPISTAEAERRSDQRFGGGRQAVAIAGHELDAG